MLIEDEKDTFMTHETIMMQKGIRRFSFYRKKLVQNSTSKRIKIFKLCDFILYMNIFQFYF